MLSAMVILSRSAAKPLLLVLAACLPTEDQASPIEGLPHREAELELRIGSVDDPEYALTFLRGVEVGSDGSIYTLHPREQVVRRFTPDGTAAGTVGGRGDGPGELQNATSMGWIADTLWILDGRGYRFNLYDAEGTFQGAFTVPFEFGERGEAGPPRARGLLADGTVHGAVPAWSQMIADGSLTHDAPVLMNRDGTVRRELPRIPFGRNQWAISDPNDERSAASYRRQPFADGPLWSFVGGERSIVVLEREAAGSAEEASFRLSKLTFGGDTVWARDYPYTPQPAPAQVIDSVLSEVSAGMGASDFFDITEATARQWASETLYRPEFRPPVEKMLVARDGSIWLSLGPDDTGQDDWLLLDSAGEPVARTTLPSRIDVQLVDPPLVYATERDELDVPYLVRYRVE